MNPNRGGSNDLFARWARFCAIAIVLVSFYAGTSAIAQQHSDVAAVVRGNNQFAFDMYHRLRASDAVAENNGNLIFSPYSISTAVGMVYAGARGQTADEIADVFHFAPPQDQLHPAYGSLISNLNGAHRTGYQLSVANRLWGQDGFPMHQPFLDTTRDQYGAELGRLDFVRDTENSRQTINRWVEEQTNDRIKDLIPPGGINEETRLVLTNAVYFNGDWKHEFNKSATQDRPFAVNASEQIRAPTMFQNGRFRYADGADFQMLELPYKGDQLSMLVVLPKAGGRAAEPIWGSSSLVASEIEPIGPISMDVFDAKLLQGGGSTVVPPAPFATIPPNGFSPGPIGLDALSALEAGLSPDVLQSAIDNLAFRDVNAYLPKFKLETGVKLGETLVDMGMPTAFSDYADFLNISDIALKINEVRHKAFIELDEEGTEAAAATSIEMIQTTCVCQPTPPILFNADHPFHFLIRDNLTGSTLFMGRVARPEGSIVAVPEPSTMGLLLAAALVVVVQLRRRLCGNRQCRVP
jgi:serine protease inhibitor